MLKLFNTKEHLLLLDSEAEIKHGGYFLLGEHHVNRYMGKAPVRYKTSLSETIIAYFPLKNSSRFLNLPLLPGPYHHPTLKDVREFVSNEDNHTEGEMGNSCIDVKTLLHFINNPTVATGFTPKMQRKHLMNESWYDEDEIEHFTESRIKIVNNELIGEYTYENT